MRISDWSSDVCSSDLAAIRTTRSISTPRLPSSATCSECLRPMYELARSLLFRLDAGRAHELTLASFRRAPKLATLPFAHAAVDDPVELLGLRFANRVGLAAGDRKSTRLNSSH